MRSSSDTRYFDILLSCMEPAKLRLEDDILDMRLDICSGYLSRETRTNEAGGERITGVQAFPLVALLMATARARTKGPRKPEV